MPEKTDEAQTAHFEITIPVLGTPLKNHITEERVIQYLPDGIAPINFPDSRTDGILSLDHISKVIDIEFRTRETQLDKIIPEGSEISDYDYIVGLLRACVDARKALAEKWGEWLLLHTEKVFSFYQAVVRQNQYILEMFASNNPELLDYKIPEITDSDMEIIREALRKGLVSALHIEEQDG